MQILRIGRGPILINFDAKVIHWNPLENFGLGFGNLRHHCQLQLYSRIGRQQLTTIVEEVRDAVPDSL